MGVESHMFERFKCDRCPSIEDVKNGDTNARGGWSHFTGQGYQGKMIFTYVATDGFKFTLCPKCTAELVEWTLIHRRKSNEILNSPDNQS
jgi:hypothetical protein